MTIHVSGRKVTSAETTASEASIVKLLPKYGWLEAVELISTDKWVQHNIWLLSGKTTTNTVALFPQQTVLNHSNWTGKVKLEPNLYLTGNFKGVLTTGVRIALHYKVSP